MHSVRMISRLADYRKPSEMRLISDAATQAPKSPYCYLMSASTMRVFIFM